MAAPHSPTGSLGSRESRENDAPSGAGRENRDLPISGSRGVFDLDSGSNSDLDSDHVSPRFTSTSPAPDFIPAPPTVRASQRSTSSQRTQSQARGHHPQGVLHEKGMPVSNSTLVTYEPYFNLCAYAIALPEGASVLCDPHYQRQPCLRPRRYMSPPPPQVRSWPTPTPHPNFQWTISPCPPPRPPTRSDLHHTMSSHNTFSRTPNHPPPTFPTTQSPAHYSFIAQASFSTSSSPHQTHPSPVTSPPPLNLPLPSPTVLTTPRSNPTNPPNTRSRSTRPNLPQNALPSPVATIQSPRRVPATASHNAPSTPLRTSFMSRALAAIDKLF